MNVGDLTPAPARTGDPSRMTATAGAVSDARNRVGVSARVGPMQIRDGEIAYQAGSVNPILLHGMDQLMRFSSKDFWY
jgi:hypothetical protein